MAKLDAYKDSLDKFDDEVFFNQKFDYLNIQSVFLDKKDGERRVVIITNDKTNLEEAARIIEPYFKGLQFKVIHRHGTAEFTMANEKNKVTVGKKIKHSSATGWGSLGGYLNGKNGEVLGVSNSHVLGNNNLGRPGDKIMYSPNFNVGTLYNYYALEGEGAINTIDAALFTLDQTNFAPDWPVPTPVSLEAHGAQPQMKVTKNGASTAITKGVVIATAGRGKVPLNGQTYNFSGIISILGTDAEKDFNEPGDSGSLVLTDPGGYIVAIVFAKHNEYCWALPFAPILDLIK